MAASLRISPPTTDELLGLYRSKYLRAGEPGWSPKLRLRFNYFSPDDEYEALVARLVEPGCTWADVGCGRDIFPQNAYLAAELAKKCDFLLGIDPSPNIKDNPYINEGFQGLVDDYQPTRLFDIVTLRMVAEHIVNPDKALAKIAQMLRPGGVVVIYTPHKWAVMSILASLSPFWLHYPIKRFLWGGEERDTFPTAYKMNTHRTLKRYCERHGLNEQLFKTLDDCRILGRFKALSWMELATRKVLNSVGLGYPEKCILAVFGKV